MKDLRDIFMKEIALEVEAIVRNTPWGFKKTEDKKIVFSEFCFSKVLSACNDFADMIRWVLFSCLDELRIQHRWEFDFRENHCFKIHPCEIKKREIKKIEKLKNFVKNWLTKKEVEQIENVIANSNVEKVVFFPTINFIKTYHLRSQNKVEDFISLGMYVTYKIRRNNLLGYDEEYTFKVIDFNIETIKETWKNGMMAGTLNALYIEIFQFFEEFKNLMNFR